MGEKTKTIITCVVGFIGGIVAGLIAFAASIRNIGGAAGSLGERIETSKRECRDAGTAAARIKQSAERSSEIFQEIRGQRIRDDSCDGS